MRIPKISNYSSISDKETLFIPETEFDKSSYIMYNEKTRSKFIKSVEKIIRSSLEYREFISYLRAELGMNFCMFFNNVSRDDIKNIGIEIHHIPFSLFDIVNIVLRKYETEELTIDPLVIADEVMRLHYEGKVGLVPLSITVHELYHRGDLFIPLQYVDKGFILFYQEYKDYMKEYEEMLKRLIVMSRNFNLNENTILKKHLIYLDPEGYNQVPQQQ